MNILQEVRELLTESDKVLKLVMNFMSLHLPQFIYVAIGL